MRVAIVALECPARLIALALELGAQGHEVIIHTRREQPGEQHTTLAEGVVVDHLPAGRQQPLDNAELLPTLGEFGRRLAARWAGHRPDVVHADGWASGLAAMSGTELSGSTRIPMLQSYGLLACRGGPRGPTHSCVHVDRAAQARLERALGRTAEASTVACGQDREDLVRIGVPRTRISIVPGTVDVEEFTRIGPACPRGDRKRLLMMTGPDPENGAGLAVRALVGVPGAQLVIAGGPEPAALETDPAANRLLLLAKDEGVDDRVILLGQVAARQTPRLIRSADLMLALDPYDPYGTHALEAMACAIPVVAAKAGGHRDVVLDNRTGILIPDLTRQRLARRLQELLADRIFRQILGAAGEDRARSRHTPHRIAAETNALYQRITS